LRRPAMVSDLTDETIAGFLAWYSSQRLYRWSKRMPVPRTVNKLRDQLLALAKLAQQKGLLREVPDVRSLPEYHHTPEAYNPADINALLVACRALPHSYCGIPAGLYWQAAILVSYDTGIRSGTLWQLQLTDVSLSSRSIRFRAETQKNRQAQILRIHSQTVAAIHKIWQPEREPLFPWAAHPQTRINHYRKILIAAGLPTGRMEMMHKLRRTTATLMHNAGGDATQQLGHSSDAVTRRSYIAPDLSQQACDLLPRPVLPDDDPQLTLF